MSIATEKDGSKTIPVNAYKDLYLFRYLFCDMAFDAPGEVVFCPEKGIERGTSITLLQSRSGYNVFVKEGLAQLIAALGPLSGVMVQFLKREYETPLEMYQSLSLALTTGHLPPLQPDIDEFVADILLLPVFDRLNKAESWDPEKMVNGILKTIHSFSNQAAFKSYKPRYRDKLMKLTSSFFPFRKEFSMFEIDVQDMRSSMFQLLLFFS